VCSFSLMGGHLCTWVVVVVHGQSLSCVGGRSHVWAVASFTGSCFRSGGNLCSYMGVLSPMGAWIAVVVTCGCWLFTGGGSSSFVWGVVAVEVIS
jgi:hypothetical protein